MSLRDDLIEAMARTWCEANGHTFAECLWEEQHLVNAGLVLDAMLDRLEEHEVAWLYDAQNDRGMDEPLTLALLSVLRVKP